MALFSGHFEFAVALGEDRGVAAFKFVLGCHESDGAVQTDSVVVFYITFYDPPGVAERQRRARPDALAFDGSVPAF